MAALRPTTASMSTLLRLASQTQPTSTARCAHCLRAATQRRTFSTPHSTRQSSKRPLMTETARPQTQPQTLDAEIPPPPPRNAGIPETSIAAGDQTTNANGNVNATTWPPSAPWDRRDGGGARGQTTAGVSEREAEAQKSKVTLGGVEQQQQQQPSSTTTATSSTSTSTSTPAPAPKKSKLRPRKAPITLTPPAIHQLRALAADGGKMIRVGVKNRGCSGLSYHLEYVDSAGKFDEEVVQEGVKVLIDSKALFSIIGSEMDWVCEKLGERFVFRNPNITEQCGCGESFSVSQ